MEQGSNENNAFLTVVENMKAGGYLQEGQAGDLKAAYERYVNDLIQKNSEQRRSFYQNKENEAAYTDNAAPHKTQANYGGFDQSNEYRYAREPQRGTAPAMTKKELSERNISYILNIGVVLILLSGVIFGTTTWGFMNNIGKAVLLCSVSVLFFIISIIAKLVIKIPKSSNAFWIMGSLFFPISLLSIGFFRLFGDYLSIWGEGKYLFGIICMSLCLPVYIWSTYRNKSRTFAWITLINITLLFSFTALSFYPSNVIFALLLLGFNCLLFAISLMAERVKGFLVLKELPLYLQFNLILSTAIALFVFDSSYLYSVNIVIASMLFFAISLSQKKDAYDYVFGLLFTCGMFMLSREIHVPGARFIVMPVIGYVFTGLSVLMSRDTSKKIRLQIFSGLSTLFGFIYIGFAMLYSSSVYDCCIGLVSLCAITANYIYLCCKTSSPLPGMAVPAQVLAVIYESANMFARYYGFRYKNEYLLLMTVLIFVVGYLLNKRERFKYVKFSSLAVSLANTFIIFLMCVKREPLLLTLPIISFVFTAQLFIFNINTKNKYLKRILNYCISALIFTTLCLIKSSYSITITGVSSPVFYFFCGLITFLLHFIPFKGLNDFKKALFFTGHAIMAFILVFHITKEQSIPICTVIYLLLGLVYIYSVMTTRKHEKIVWLYAGLVGFSLFISNVVIIQLNDLFAADLASYTFHFIGFPLIGLYFILKNTDLKKHIATYLSILTMVEIITCLSADMLWHNYIAEIVIALLIYLCLVLSKRDILGFFPLSLIFAVNHILANSILKGSAAALPVIALWFIVLVAAGILKYRLVFDVKNTAVDWLSLLAIASIFNLRGTYADFDILWLTSMLPGLMCAAWFCINRKRLFQMGEGHRPGNLLFTLSLLWPYYSLLNSIIGHIREYRYELVLLPLVALTCICVKWIYRGVKNTFLQLTEYMVPALAYLALLTALFYTDNIWHSLILGAAGLISLLYATVFKTKSALVLGGAIILASVFIQTRTFWFNVQWWIYLLFLGLILIIIASINEYQKNKKNTNVLSKMSGFLNRFSDWD